MAKLIFRLNNVPEQEADAVRELLTEHDIEYYETFEGRWGLSVAAIWIKDNSESQRARQLIDEFQQVHTQQMRDQFQADKAEGNIPTMWQILRARPAMFAMYWALIVFVVFVSIAPVYRFFNHS